MVSKTRDLPERKKRYFVEKQHVVSEINTDGARIGARNNYVVNPGEPEVVSELFKRESHRQHDSGLPTRASLPTVMSVTVFDPVEAPHVGFSCFGHHSFLFSVTTCSALLHVQSLLFAMFPMIPTRGAGRFHT